MLGRCSRPDGKASASPAPSAEEEAFVRLSLGALLDHGAIPFRVERRSADRWDHIPVPGLGSTREQVIDAITHDFLEQGGEAPDMLDGLAFATQAYIDGENAAG
jgi:hypothetical protein